MQFVLGCLLMTTVTVVEIVRRSSHECILNTFVCAFFRKKNIFKCCNGDRN